MRMPNSAPGITRRRLNMTGEPGERAKATNQLSAPCRCRSKREEEVGRSNERRIRALTASTECKMSGGEDMRADVVVWMDEEWRGMTIVRGRMFGSAR